ncbi:phosphoribosylpyrophosphate synthetase [Leptospira langatensis]|uniref:Phosphoribosylpyrophosphate synthetase n=1 Tax=Leptospira langatensis TaxID=2484983 RepID=A0A5F1ZSK3_9LEPT|nr:phosphoribosylpyrophosphate synthetase [Leptospira langatensis]TGJ98813.1 phosphoribosylpyrophosphate synthetase [Leptospira langatensis]TGL40620.1 phosphoribosylpyrophosphate synthetase [Leptospira langatensis]
MKDANHSFETVTDAVNSLKAEGYSEDYNLHWGKNNKECRIYVSTSEFKVDRFYRFEGDTDPADEAIVYAISSDTFKEKGILVDGYGIYSEQEVSELVAKLIPT